MKRALIAITLGAVLMLSAACAGVKARENVLMPAMSMAWTVVVTPLVERSLAADPPSDAETAAIRDGLLKVRDLLDSGDVDKASAIQEVWRIVWPMAIAGVRARIDAGEIGVNGGAILMETLRQFNDRLKQL